MNEQLFFQVIVPLMGVSGTSILGISTPNSNENQFYNRLMDIPDPDNMEESMFKTIRIGLACNACVEKKKPLECTHKASLVPHWKDSASQRKMKIIMDGRDKLFLNENMGMRTNTNNYVFPSIGISRLSVATPHRWDRNPDVLFCAIDPSGGGKQSEYAMCTVACIGGGGFVIVAIDSIDSADISEVTQMIYDHLMRIRRFVRYRNSTIIVYIEANMSWTEVSRVSQICMDPRLRPVIIESFESSSEEKAGVITTHANKAAYVNGLMHILQDGQIRYAAPLLSSDPERARRLLESQLRQFRKIVKASNDVTFQQAKVTYSGKSSHDCDDLAMVLMMVIYWGYLTRDKPTFVEMMDVNGWLFA